MCEPSIKDTHIHELEELIFDGINVFRHRNEVLLDFLYSLALVI